MVRATASYGISKRKLVFGMWNGYYQAIKLQTVSLRSPFWEGCTGVEVVSREWRRRCLYPLQTEGQHLAARALRKRILTQKQQNKWSSLLWRPLFFNSKVWLIDDVAVFCNLIRLQYFAVRTNPGIELTPDPLFFPRGLGYARLTAYHHFNK